MKGIPWTCPLYDGDFSVDKVGSADLSTLEMTAELLMKIVIYIWRKPLWLK